MNTQDRINALKKLEKEMDEDFKRIMSGELFGTTSGFESLDGLVGRIRDGSLWLIGGYSGTGKSFFVLNMIEGIIEEAKTKKDKQPPKIAIFSTELTDYNYSTRHILMRCGMYFRELEYRDPHKLDLYNATCRAYMQERYLNPYTPDVIGNVKRLEDIEDYVREIRPTLFFVDYVQELTVECDGRTLVREEESMAEISARLVHLVKETKSSCVAISQINNYMVNSNSESNRLSPFSFGKQMNQSSDTSLLLHRKKKNSRLSNVLEVEVIKARNGSYGKVPLKINPGYKLSMMTPEEHKHLMHLFDQE